MFSSQNFEEIFSLLKNTLFFNVWSNWTTVWNENDFFFYPPTFFWFFPHSPNFHVQSFKKLYNKMYGFLKKRVLLGNKIDVLPNTHWGKTQFFSPKIIFVKKFTNLRIWILAPKLPEFSRENEKKYRKIIFCKTLNFWTKNWFLASVWSIKESLHSSSQVPLFRACFHS